MPDQPKYPDIRVQLTGTDSNAFALMFRVRTALKRAGVPPEEVEAFSNEALSGDYAHVIATCRDWVEVS